jgi:signal transduction histidine kinase
VTRTLTTGAISIADLAPVSVLVVVVIAAIDGSWPGVVSGLLMAAYAAYVDSSSGRLFTSTSGSLMRLLMFVAVITATAVVVGTLQRKIDLLRTELRTQRRQTAEATRSKSDFMNVAGHELRTPLTVISGYVAMLQDETFGRLPERLQAPIRVMQRKTYELTALVEEMLLSARIQRGTAPTATIPLDVRDAVRKAVERAGPRVTLERAMLSYEVPSTPALAEMDSDHLGHILDALINNALTYSDPGPWVKITVTSGSETRVLVKDRGWGVPEAMRHKIFERFIRYEDPAHKPKKGVGLGLSTSRELAERYGGSLDLVRTDPGKGSLFVLRFPAVGA